MLHPIWPKNWSNGCSTRVWLLFVTHTRCVANKHEQSVTLCTVNRPHPGSIDEMGAQRSNNHRSVLRSPDGPLCTFEGFNVHALQSNKPHNDLEDLHTFAINANKESIIE